MKNDKLKAYRKSSVNSVLCEIPVSYVMRTHRINLRRAQETTLFQQLFKKLQGFGIFTLTQVSDCCLSQFN